MKLIDLTHTFTWPMPVYPGDPEPVLTELSSVQKDGYLDVEVTSGLHVGTHIDAPAHMIVGGKQLSDYPLERFIGRGVLVDARGKRQISDTLIRHIEFQPGDIVLVMTGWSQWYRVGSTSEESPSTKPFDHELRVEWLRTGVPTSEEKPRYFEDYPIFTENFAERLASADISMVGMDTPSPDPSSPDGYPPSLEATGGHRERASEENLYPIHHQLFEADILIAENVNHLDQLANIDTFEVIALPTKFATDSAPARVIARVQ